MKPRVRKPVLSAHLTFSVGWIGAALAYLGLAIHALGERQLETIRATWIARELIGWYVIVPLAVATLISGVVLALATKWGLFRHYWVMFSLVLTLFATVVLVMRMPAVAALSRIAQDADARGMATLENDLLHPGIGLIVLLVIHVLNIYKPAGLTRYGWRKQKEQRGKNAAEREVMLEV